MTKGCYTCRRRRIICDNGLPTCRKCRDAGKECLGYQKPLVWVKGGVASRGKMMGRSFDDVSKPTSDRNGGSSTEKLPDQTVESFCQLIPEKPEDEDEEVGVNETSTIPLSGDSQSRNINCLVRAADYVPTPVRLVDPAFKDLGHLSRMYIFHLNEYLISTLVLYPSTRNPYRDLLGLVGESPLLANALTATGALHYALMADGDFSPMPWSSNATVLTGEALSPEEMEKAVAISIRRRPKSRVYEHFLGFKQRALHQVSEAICDPEMRTDNRTLAAIMVLTLMDAVESGDGAWKYHLEGAKRLLKLRQDCSNKQQTKGIMDWLDTFAIDGCLIFELMGSTLARPGTLSKPFYTSSMDPTVLKRLEKTTWVGCPAYLLEVIFFVHAGWCWEDTEGDHTSSQPKMVFSSAFLPENSNPLNCPDALLQHIQAFDPVAWAESLQSYLFLPDMSIRIALARVYKAAVYLYASRVLARPRPGFASTPTSFGLPGDHEAVSHTLIRQIALVPVDDPHFKCLIWPTFIAGAECRDPFQRPLILDRLSKLYYAIASVNVRNAGWVLSLMWRKQDLKRDARRDHNFNTNTSPSCSSSSDFPLSPGSSSVYDHTANNDEDFDWVQELDDSRVDWLFI